MNGILLVDKPQGFTSHDAIAKLRGILKERRLGHAGTLDPMATGLLVVFAGRATRAVQFAENDSKQYIATMRTGITTDTQDITGNIMSTYSGTKTVSETELCKLIPEFTGELSQIPPMYSAIKQDGKKLYELARKGVEVERKSRQITIHKMEYMGKIEEDFQLRIDCSKGTYIRTLCHDMGKCLGTGAVLTSLRRTYSGAYTVENAFTLEQIASAAQQGNVRNLFLPVDSLFMQCPQTVINEEQKRKCLVGNSFSVELQDGEYRVYDADGTFLMLGRVDCRIMSTKKSFFEITAN